MPLLQISIDDAGAWMIVAQIVGSAAAGSIALMWLGGIFWVANDVSQRTRQTGTRWACIAAAALFFLPGLLAYILLRPRETMAERAERKMENALIARQAAAVPICPGCSRAVSEDFVRCPYCAASLGSSCDRCGKPNMTAWVACPYCGSAKPVALAPLERRYAPRALPELAPAPVMNIHGARTTAG